MLRFIRLLQEIPAFHGKLRFISLITKFFELALNLYNTYLCCCTVHFVESL